MKVRFNVIKLFIKAYRDTDLDDLQPALLILNNKIPDMYTQN